MKKLIVLALVLAASSPASGETPSHWECIALNNQDMIMVLTPGMRQPVRSGDQMSLGMKGRLDPSYPETSRVAPYWIYSDGVSVSFDIGLADMRDLSFVIKPDGSGFVRTRRYDGHAEKSDLVCQWYAG